MRLRPLIIVLLLVVIAGLIVTTSAGSTLLGTDILPGLSSLVDFGSGSNELFQMQSAVLKGGFSGYTFELKNTSLQVTGLCVGYVSVFGANHLKDTRCSIFADGAKGKLQYSNIGTLEATIEADSLTLDNSLIIPSRDKRVVFSIVPSDFFLSNYDARSISLPAVTGEVKKFKSDGSEDQVKNLVTESIKITNYIGNVRLTSNTIILNGFASKVNWFS